MRDWCKVICCPRVTATRLYYMLYLRHNKQEKFDKIRMDKGDEILPSEMVEQSIQIYEPPKATDNSLDGGQLSCRLDQSVPDWQLMSSTGQLKGRKRTLRKGQERHNDFAR